MPRDEIDGRWSRRHFLGVGVGAFVVASLPLAISRRTVVARRSVPMMGTIAELTVVHRDERVAQESIDAAIDALRRTEWTMTRFSAASDIGRANAGAAREGVPISSETGRVLMRALQWAEASEGRFDPAIGSVVELWDVANRHEPPPSATVRPLASRGFWRKIDLSSHGGELAVRFEDRDVRLDLGGIAKGYGVDRAVRALRERGVEHAIVNVGGDLYALGDAPDGDRWRVGIRSPHDARLVATTLHVSDQAVATSGDYAQFFRWRGRRYHHLMDPETAGPRVGTVASVTVQADACIDADAAATAAFGLDDDAARRVVHRIAHTARVITMA